MTTDTPTALHLTVPDEAWTGTDDTDSHLVAPPLVINGQSFHLEAIAVRPDSGDGWQEAVNPNDNETLDLLHAASGASSPLETLSIGGRDYVVYATPYC